MLAVSQLLDPIALTPHEITRLSRLMLMGYQDFLQRNFYKVIATIIVMYPYLKIIVKSL